MIDIQDNIKELYTQDGYKKGINIHFPNGEHEDITNENIVSESASLTESLCSQNTLKFGLCEASKFECEVFGLSESMKGKEIEVTHELYNVDYSENVKVSDTIFTEESIGDNEYKVIDLRLRDVTCIDVSFDSFVANGNYLCFKYYNESNEVVGSSRTFYSDMAETTARTNINGENVSYITIEINSSSATSTSFSFTNCKFSFNNCTYYIPYGHFIINSCKKQSNMSRRKIIAYDKIYSDNLDVDYTDEIKALLEDTTRVCKQNTVYEIEKYMSDSFGIVRSNSIIPLNKLHTSTTTNITGNIKSADGRQTNYEFWDRTFDVYNFTDSDKSEYFNLQIDLGEFMIVGNYIKYNMDKYGFSFVNGLWITDHCVEVIVTNNSDKSHTYTEKDSVNLILTLNDITNIKSIKIKCANSILAEYYQHSSDTDTSLLDRTLSAEEREEVVEMISLSKIGGISDIERIVVSPGTSSVTLRNVLSSVCELHGMFGNINKYTNQLEECSINSFGLYPVETLFPSELIYPTEGGEVFDMNMYESAWYGDESVGMYGKIVASIKVDSEEKILSFVMNSGLTNVYDLSENWIIQNGILTEAEILSLIQEMGEKIRYIHYIPCNVKAKGFPWMEIGDVAKIKTNDGEFEAFILKRTLSGIRSLRDNFVAEGD